MGTGYSRPIENFDDNWHRRMNFYWNMGRMTINVNSQQNEYPQNSYSSNQSLDSTGSTVSSRLSNIPIDSIQSLDSTGGTRIL